MGVLGSPSRLFLRERERGEKNGEGVSSVQGVETRKNRIVRFLKADSPIFPGQPKLVFDNLSFFKDIHEDLKALKPWNEDPIQGIAHKRMRISQKGILT
jgi:hypothetical protein